MVGFLGPRNTLNIVKGNGLLERQVVSSLAVINKMVSKRACGNNSLTLTTSKFFPKVSSMKTKKPIVLHLNSALLKGFEDATSQNCLGSIPPHLPSKQGLKALDSATCTYYSSHLAYYSWKV